MSKDLVKAPSAAMAKRLAKAQGKGNEHVTTDDIILPVLILVQAQSPQTVKKSDAYIEGCSAGDLINSLTRENYGEELFFIPITYRRTFREHEARTGDRIGNFLMEHTEYDMSVLEENEKGFNCIVPDNGHEIVQTANDLALILPGASVPQSGKSKGQVLFDGDLEPIMIRSRYTKWRMAKQLNSLAKRLTINVGGQKMEAPRFSGYYRLFTEYVDGVDNPYYNWGVEFIGWASEQHYMEAEAFYDSVVGKTIKTAGDEEEQATDDDAF